MLMDKRTMTGQKLRKRRRIHLQREVGMLSSSLLVPDVMKIIYQYMSLNDLFIISAESDRRVDAEIKHRRMICVLQSKFKYLSTRPDLLSYRSVLTIEFLQTKNTVTVLNEHGLISCVMCDSCDVQTPNEFKLCELCGDTLFVDFHDSLAENVPKFYCQLYDYLWYDVYKKIVDENDGSYAVFNSDDDIGKSQHWQS